MGGDLATATTTSSTQVRWIDFDEAPTILTFETERALVARAADLLVAPPRGAGFVTDPQDRRADPPRDTAGRAGTRRSAPA